MGWRDECDALAAARVAAEASLTRLCNGALQMAFHAWVRAASFDSAEAIAALKDGQLSLEAELDMLRADKERLVLELDVVRATLDGANRRATAAEEAAAAAAAAAQAQTAEAETRAVAAECYDFGFNIYIGGCKML